MGRAGGSEPFGSWPLHDLLDELASEAPAPGGGPLAGLVVAMAAALVAKVARGSAEAWPEAGEAAATALELRDRAHWLAGADLDAHLRALEALGAGGDGGGLGDALAHAAEMPLALAGAAAEVAALAAEAAARCVPDRAVDAQAAALLAAAAAQAAARLVEVNLTTLPHDERVRTALAHARAAAEAAARPT